MQEKQDKIDELERAKDKLEEDTQKMCNHLFLKL